MTSKSEQTILIYTTFPSELEAKKAGTALVRQKLAACINILPAMTAIYEWDGKIEQEAEVVMLVKTAKDRQQQAIEEIVRLHSYDVPAALVIDVPAGNEKYLTWLTQQTRG